MEEIIEQLTLHTLSLVVPTRIRFLIWSAWRLVSLVGWEESHLWRHRPILRTARTWNGIFRRTSGPLPSLVSQYPVQSANRKLALKMCQNCFSVKRNCFRVKYMNFNFFRCPDFKMILNSNSLKNHTFLKRFFRSAMQAHAATNQQFPKEPCEKSSAPRPSVKKRGLETISWKQIKHKL